MVEKTPELEQALAAALSLTPLDKVRLVEQIMATLERDLSPSDKSPKRSLYGLWQGISTSEEDIAQARKEMWGNFPHEDL